MSSFLFVRHGHALHNQAFEESNYDESVFKDPRFRDAPLTEKGLNQVQECAEALRDRYSHSIRVIFTSPLTRCIQTARAIASVSPHTKIIVTDSLLECLGGNHVCNTRKSYGELILLHSDLQFQHISAYQIPTEDRPRETEEEIRERSKAFYPLVLPYMEMYPDSTMEDRPRETEEEVRERSKAFYPLVVPYMEMYPTSTIVVVTHHDWVKANWGVKLGNAEYHIVSSKEIEEKIRQA